MFFKKALDNCYVRTGSNGMARMAMVPVFEGEKVVLLEFQPMHAYLPQCLL